MTWNYWKRAVKSVDLLKIRRSTTSLDSTHRDSDEDSGNGRDSSQAASRTEDGGTKAANNLPCRIVLNVSGLQWFVYNRTPAYDDILSGFRTSSDHDEKRESKSSPVGTKATGLDGSEKYVADRFDRTSSDTSASGSASDPITRDASQPHRTDTKKIIAVDPDVMESVSKFLQLLPIQVNCTKGAIVAGNENTRSVMTVTFERATGLIDATDAGPLDLYRQIFTFDFTRPIIQLRPNPDFKQSQLSAVRNLNSPSNDESRRTGKKAFIFNYQRRKREIWRSIRDLVPYFQTSVESFHIDSHDKGTNTTSTSRTGLSADTRWVGLSRYIDDNTDDHEGWNAVEYGRYSTLVDCPSLTLTYYWDIPGKVCSDYVEPPSSIRMVSRDINGSHPPQWGIDLKIEGGMINYGPWADRERVGLQNVFFPNNFRSAQPAEPLKPSSLRRSTNMKIRIEISDDTTLRIPIREESKDWQWKGRADAIRGASKLKKQKQKRESRRMDGEKGKVGPEIRPFGWLTLRVSQDSSITYDIDMVASKSGFSNQLVLDLRDCKMSSSVNHGLLWQSPRQVVTCDLSNPLVWNSLHEWSFTVVSYNLQLFLLRDHAFLITDLVSDWTSGSTSDYYTFVPYVYNMKLIFTDVRLYLNVNDSNIINNPSDVDDNTFIVIKGKHLESHVAIPAKKYKPESNAVTFDVNLEEGGVDLLTPLWHTLHIFLDDESVGTLERLTIHSSYTYNAGTSTALTDTLNMNVIGTSPRCYLHGFLIRYFMKIRENYFGENMHFKTLEEFQIAANSNDPSAAFDGINPNKKSNDLDVIINVVVEGPCALLPTNIYDHATSLRLTAASLDLDLRFTNYYMDLQACLTPTEVSLESLEDDGTANVSNTQLFIEDISVHGHRLFGLPPTEPTYVCNWDFDVGRVVGECSPEFLGHTTAALRNLDFTFDDEENSLPPLYSLVLNDVTFLRARVASVHLSLLVDRTAVILGFGRLDLQFNDWSRLRFSKRLSLTVPNVNISAVDRNSAARLLQKRSSSIITHGLFQTYISLSMLRRKARLHEERRLQQDHIEIHDQRTHRTPWLLLDSEDASAALKWKGPKINPPAMILPFMPKPILDANLIDSSASSLASRLQHGLHRKNSFLSLGRVSSHSNNDVERDVRSNSQLNEGQPARRAAFSSENLPSNGITLQLPPSEGSRRYEDAYLSMNEGSYSVIGPSNAWAIPNFHYYKIEPDSSKLPHLPNVSPAPETVVDDGDFIEATDDHDSAHTDIFCELVPGIRGFCTPEFLYALSSVVHGLQSPDIKDIFDSLQTDVVSDIVKHEKTKKKTPKAAVSFTIRIPSAIFRLLNQSDSSDNGHQHPFQDEYRISCSRLRATIQTKSERREHDLIKDSQNSLTFHARADMASVCAFSGQANLHQEQVELTCTLKDLVFWLASASGLRSHLQMRSFETVTSTRSVEPLAFLVRRTTTLLDGITSSFQSVPSTADRRRYLVWSLTHSTVGITDPFFLTRPSYVLRASGTHLRLHDSWKIISRLRNVYKNLSAQQKQALETNCVKLGYTCPKNARDKVLQNFNEWRPWDLALVEKSHAMKKIWGEDINPSEDSTSRNVKTFSCAIKALGFVIDPGPKQSDVKVETLSIAIASKPTVCTDENRKMNRRDTLTFRSHCSKTALHLRWEILDLVEGVARTMSNVELKSATSTSIQGPERNAQQLTQYHFVIGTDEGSITLDGINLELALLGYGLKASLVYSPKYQELQEQTTILLSGQDCSTTFSNRSKILMLWEIWQPNVYISYVLDKSSTNGVYDWKIACSCRSFIYDMQEDPLGLVHTADRVVEDEVRFVRDLCQRLNMQKSRRSSSATTDTSAKSDDIHKFHVALFLDDYQLSFRLLPSLIYVIDGRVARMSVVSHAGGGVELDFDVKNKNHAFRSLEEGKSHAVSEIDVPPINGRVRAQFFPKVLSVQADVTVELIRLEASALRSLLNVVNRPEISHYLSDFAEGIEELKLHLDETLVNKQERPHSSDSFGSRDIFYKVRLTMAGLGIHARAPGFRSKDYSADMDFLLGSTQLRLDNTAEPKNVSEYPEFHVNVSQIGLELRKRDAHQTQRYGSLMLDVGVVATSRSNERNEVVRAYHLTSKGLDVQLYAETASLVIDIAAHLQERIKTLDLTEDMKRLMHLRHLARPRNRANPSQVPEISVVDEAGSRSPPFFSATYSVELTNIQTTWVMDDRLCPKSGHKPEDLVFSIRRVALSTTRESSAKLRIQDVQLQMTPKLETRQKRSLNSALMPEIVFNVAYLSTKDDLRLAFQAAGKSLDIRLTTDFILPANMLQNSIASATERLREANAIWTTSPSQPASGKTLFGNKRLSSLLVDVDFAGAIVSLLGKQLEDQQRLLVASATGGQPAEARYGQYVQGDSTTTASLRAPGVAFKVQYGDNGNDDPALNAEVRVSPSSNTLYPTVVPLIKQISSSVKEVVGEQKSARPQSSDSNLPSKPFQESSLDAANPESILGRCKLNLGIRICKQEFSLSCQPIARVAATAQFEDIYMTMNTVQSAEQRRFFAIVIAFNSLKASVKHVYSNESTASFEVQSVVMSLMNSKHVSTTSGLSAILKVSPMKIMANAKQVQDFLLFREIWIPSGDDVPLATTPKSGSPTPADSQALIVQRYQQVASAGAFPWNTAISIEEVGIQLDLGQTLGKADFTIKDLWVSSKKASDWEQNLCGGFGIMAIESKGRMSGTVELQKLKVRTSIIWPDETPVLGQTPLIQASIGFDQLQINASFEYQPFLVADIAMFDFLMYNVRGASQPSPDRLVSILEGERVQVFCTTLTAGQSLALFQTWQRLAQDKYAAYESSLKEIEKYLRRKSSALSSSSRSPAMPISKKDEIPEKAPISLHTDVVVTLRAINVGAFPSTFFDNQIFKIEALDAQARFAVSLQDDKIRSALGLTLGQLRVALSSINRPTAAEMAELSVGEVAARATGSRGGTILKVPRVVASMETWQTMGSNEIEYIFKSAFEGKVDVGWNYSRVSFIRGMWTNHSRALASRLGKPLPPSAVHITGGPKPQGSEADIVDEGDDRAAEEGEKITAVVNVPQSRYVYRAREPALIETPQLRDMGEATPPLEWIGLNRDKLPHITHQIIIVTLLEVAKEVEDAYEKILG